MVRIADDLTSSVAFAWSAAAALAFRSRFAFAWSEALAFDFRSRPVEPYNRQRLLRLDIHLPLRLNRQIAIGADCAVAFDIDRQFVLFAVEFNDIAALILDGDRWRAITRLHQDLF